MYKSDEQNVPKQYDTLLICPYFNLKGALFYRETLIESVKVDRPVIKHELFSAV